MSSNINNYVKKLTFSLVIIFFSSIFSIYLCELFLTVNTIKKYNSSFEEKIIKNKKFDKRTSVEFYHDNEGKIIPSTPPTLININKNELVLHSIPFKKTFLKNENGYYPIYMSDRYGYNNDDTNYDREVEFLFIGDSFTHGCCVNPKDNVVEKFINLSGKNSINLGMGGNGSLTNLATFSEFHKIIKPKNIVIMHFEGNDLNELEKEIHFKELNKYLSKELDFGYLSKFNEKTKVIEDYLEYKTSSLKKRTRLKLFLKLNEIRSLLRQVNFKKQATNNIKPNFKEENKNDENPKISNSNLKRIFEKYIYIANKFDYTIHFVYIPFKLRYTDPDSIHLEGYNYLGIKNFMNANKINFIDFKDFLDDYSDYSKIYPIGFAHFNEKGYDLLSQFIYKKVTQN